MTLEEIVLEKSRINREIKSLINKEVELVGSFLNENAKYQIGFEFVTFSGELTKVSKRDIYQDLKGCYIIYEYIDSHGEHFLSEEMLNELVAENYKLKDK
jgi:hypothetical protein